MLSSMPYACYCIISFGLFATSLILTVFLKFTVFGACEQTEKLQFTMLGLNARNKCRQKKPMLSPREGN